MRLSDKTYQVLKWAGLIFLPALAVLVSVVFPVWGADEALTKAIVTTLNAAGVFIGACIGVSAANKPDENGTETDKTE